MILTKILMPGYVSPVSNDFSVQLNHLHHHGHINAVAVIVMG